MFEGVQLFSIDHGAYLGEAIQLTMASSKKSLMDKFLPDSKTRSPGKKNRKTSKASKSLSRELTKSPASPVASKKRAEKAGSDTMVVLRRDEDDSDTDVFLPVVLKPERDTEEPMEIEFDKPIHVEKLHTSLTAKWSRPDGSVYSPLKATVSDDELPVFSKDVRKSDALSTSVNSKSQGIHSSTPLYILSSDSTSSVTSCPSSDSLASEMESYRLGSRSSSTSDVDTLKNSACEEINISECSSTSTPIKFSLFESNRELSTSMTRKPKPKFSLIREVATEDLDNLSLSSELSPTTTGTSFRSIDRNRIDDFSDESDSSRMKESAEFSDDPDFHTHFHFVPLNKQLQIVTSMDRLIDR